jgi:peroxiredoxin
LGQINDRAKTMNTSKLHRPLKPWGRTFAKALAFFPALVCAAALGTSPAMAQPAAGSKAVTAPVTTPSIEGKTIEGKPFALSSLKGKVVLVMYWSTGCAVCRDKMPELRTNYSGWAGKPFELVAISTDARMQDVTDYEQIITRTVPLKQRFVQLWTGDATYRDNLGKHVQLPAAYLVDKSGKIVERYVGRIPAEAWDRIADLL